MESVPYVPTLPMKLGETFALKDVPLANRGVDIRPRLIAPKEVSKNVIPRLFSCWGIDRFFADLTALEASSARIILTQMHDAGLRPIPVVSLANSLAQLRVARDFVAAHSERACLALPATAATSADCEARLSYLFSALDVGCEELDLILDFGHIDERFALANAVRVLDHLPHFDRWRSLTVSASSFPERIRDCKGYQKIADKLRIVSLPRVEWDVYQKIVGGGYSRPIAFGDTGVTYVGGEGYAEDEDEEGGQGRRPAPNIRYTTAEGRFEIIRGDYFIGNSDMHRICKALTKMPFFTRGMSAGDDGIHSCSRRNRNPGGSSKWRQWDLNHHFHMTINQLATFAET